MLCVAVMLEPAPLLLVLIVSTTGCIEESAAEGSRPRPSPYEADTPEASSSPSITPAMAEAAVPALFEATRALDPEAVFADYLALFAHGDGEACPERESYASGTDSTVFWYSDGCSTSDGTWFSGSGFHAVAETKEDDGTVTRVVSFGDDGAFFEIVAPDGRLMRGSPSIELIETRSPDGSKEFEAYAAGALESDEATAIENIWLRGEVEGSFGLYGYEDPSGYRSLTYYGLALATATVPGVSAFSLAEVGIDNAEGCAMRTGTISMRDAAGSWHDAFFGAEEGESGDERCDACATLSHAGTDLGSFCTPAAAFDGLLTWGARPW